MKHFRSRFVAICCIGAFAQAGCAFNASPADGLRFAPPPGWRSMRLVGFMQFWRPPSNDREVLMLFKSPTAIAPNEVFNNANMHDTLKDLRVQRRRAIEICGNQPATYVQAQGSSAKGDENVDMVMATVRGTSYIALYVRPVGIAPNASAQAALRELCAKP
ncbi:MAG TPA: hypothetical protein VGZ06_06200 [Candidatus Cybelea sp.]|nr:hypothetical protein [Candidatus Cybelea sp.]